LATHRNDLRDLFMTDLTIDPSTLAKLRSLGEVMRLSDESGRILGYFHPVSEIGVEPGSAHRSPFSHEELQRRRQQRAGRPLSEILESYPPK